MNSRHLEMTAVIMVSAILTLALLWFLGSSSLPVTAGPATTTASPRYVSTTGTDRGDCTDSVSPCRTVQYAVDRAGKGDTIRVASGIYTGVNVRPRYDFTNTDVVTQIAYITKSIIIQGGYTTTNGFADPPDPVANPTTLDAQGQGRGIYISGASSATVAGLHITGGNAIGLAGGQWIYDSGGGVYVVSATATLSDNYVFGNVARDGGGVYVSNSAVTLKGNQVFDNTAGNSGGGMCVVNGDYYPDEYNIGTTVTMIGNRVFSNTADSSGGGIYVNNDTFAVEVDGLSAELMHNQVFSNIAGYEGGGMFIGRSHIYYGSRTIVTLVGNTVAGNRAKSRGGGLLLRFTRPTLNRNGFIANTADYGGGIFLAPYSGGTFTNTIIVDNWANTAGSGLYSLTSSPSLLHTTIARNRGGDGSGLLISWETVGDVIPTTRVDLVNVIVASQTVGITMTRDIVDPWIDTGDTTLNGVLWFDNGANIGGMGTISITQAYTGDPAFVDPGARDYHVGPDSAAIDRGVNAGVVTDIDGEPRPAGAGYDIGADEYHCPTLEVVKRAYPDQVEPGAPLTYTICVTNTSYVDLHATITDTLPPHIASGRTSEGTVVAPGGQIIWSALVTAPGGVWTETVVVTVAESYDGSLTNFVEVTTEEGAAGNAVAIVNSYKVYLPLIVRN